MTMRTMTSHGGHISFNINFGLVRAVVGCTMLENISSFLSEIFETKNLMVIYCFELLSVDFHFGTVGHLSGLRTAETFQNITVCAIQNQVFMDHVVKLRSHE